MRADVFFLSALAKLGATVVTYPLLLVKSRLMSAGKHTSSDRKYTGTVDAIERIYKTEGDLCQLCLEAAVPLMLLLRRVLRLVSSSVRVTQSSCAHFAYLQASWDPVEACTPKISQSILAAALPIVIMEQRTIVTTAVLHFPYKLRKRA